jgi:hypothetical protein
MARPTRSRSWRIALSTGAAFGLAFGGAVQAAEPTIKPGDNSDSAAGKSSLNDADMDAAFQTLGVSTVKAGSSSYAVRKVAISELPLASLPEDARDKAQRILDNLAMFRHLPTLSFDADPDVYSFFLQNPDIAVSTWRAMEISKFQLKEVETGCYAADAGDGSVGRIEILMHTADSTLIYCDGSFKSPLLPRPIVARSLMRLQTSFSKDADGRIIGTHSGDVFVEFPSQAVETVAKVISPMSHAIADRNFKQITLFAHLMTQAMAKHPAWIEAIGRKMDGVTDEQRQDFLAVSARSYVMSRKRLVGADPNNVFTLDDVLSPFRLPEDTVRTPTPLKIRVGTAVLRD